MAPVARRTRSSLAAAAASLVALALWGVPAPARAASLQTWMLSSRYVEPAKTTFNSPPPGVPDRPAALRVNVLLPDGYDGKRRFPVLYLLHGHGDSFDSWANAQRGDLLDLAKGFAAIVVMPEAATGWYTNWWDGGARGADGRGWESFHLDELIPMVESRLAVASGRANHAIAGLSMGGEGAIYYATQRPGYFGAAASFSGVLSLQRPEWPNSFDTQGQSHSDVYGDPTAQQFYWAGHDPTALVGNLRQTRLFVTVGDGTDRDPSDPAQLTNYFGALAETELRQHAQDFAAAAQGAGEDVTYQPRDGLHDWDWWRQHLAAAMGWGFFKPVDEHPSAWAYSTVSQTGRAWDISFSFRDAPASLETFTRAGDTLTGRGSGEVVLHPDGRPSVTASLPFSITLPPPASSSSTGPKARGRPAARRCRPKTKRRRSRRPARSRGRADARRRAGRRRARCPLARRRPARRKSRPGRHKRAG